MEFAVGAGDPLKGEVKISAGGGQPVGGIPHLGGVLQEGQANRRPRRLRSVSDAV